MFKIDLYYFLFAVQVDHRSFYIINGHENPSQFPMNSKTSIAEHVFIGNFELSLEAKERINNYIEVTSDTRPDDPAVKMHSGRYYHCDDVFNPRIGDLRIQFSIAGVAGELYTVIGTVHNGNIVPFFSKAGKFLMIVRKGELSLEDTLRKEHQAQKLTTWGIRFIGFIFIFTCVSCLSQLITHLCKVFIFKLISVLTAIFLIAIGLNAAT